MKKKCSQCGFECDKKVAEEFFHRDKSREDGLQCWCKKCLNKRNKAYRETDKGRAYQKKYRQSEKGKAAHQKAGIKYRQSEKGEATHQRADIKYRQSEKYRITIQKYQKSEKFKAYQREYWRSDKGKAVAKKNFEKQQLLYPERLKARRAVSHAIIARKLICPDRCSICGIKCKPEAHHKDYNKPLEVEWLCMDVCHPLADEERRRKENEKSDVSIMFDSNDRGCDGA